MSITSAPAEGTISKGEVEYTWKGSGGSGGLKYSYCLVGWSKISGSSVVKYHRGFSSRKSLIWSPWTRDTKARLCYVTRGIYTFHVKVKDSKGRVSVYHKTRSFRGTKQSNICDGALLKGSSATVYVMKGGLRRHVRNPATFQAEGYLGGNINVIADSTMGSIPKGQPLLDALADGNLLKGSSATVYVMEGGLKRHAVSAEMFLACGYGFGAVRTISDGQLAAIPTGSPLTVSSCPRFSPGDGALLKGSSDTIYVMQGGLTRNVRNPVTFEAEGYQWGNINVIADSTLGSIPEGQPLLDALADGNLLKGSAADVYVMEGGQKRHAVDAETFLACGYGSDAVRKIPDSRLAGIPTGSPLDGSSCPRPAFADGTLLKGSAADVWVMENGQKRHAVSAEMFLSCGYQSGNINRIADSSLASIPVGDDLAEGSCP